MTQAQNPPSRWLFGPLPDLLLGCGLWYFAAFALLCVAGPEMRRVVPYGLAPLVLLVSGTPHYGATLLRVYERRDDRRAYTLFSVYASILIAIAFVVSLRSVLVGSVLLTVMLTWSPWHYTGQNYGIALMLLGRRGVSVTPLAKRVIYGSFMLSYGLTFLAIHASAPGSDYAPTSYNGSIYRLIPLGIPHAVSHPLLIGGAIAYVGLTVVAGAMLLRGGRLRDLGPAGLIAASQALWFTVPVLARGFGWFAGLEPLGADQAAYAFLWVAVAHSVQYLWVTAYYARRSGAQRSNLLYLGKSLLAGAAIWTLPALIFAPAVLGSVPFDAGLAVMVSVAVNIHHFILDGAIWKLRDRRVASVLLRAPDVEARPAPIGVPAWRRGFVAPLVWVSGAVCVGVIVAGTLEAEFGLDGALERADLDRARRAVQHLAWIGRDSPGSLARVGALAAQQGHWQEGYRDVQHSLETFPTAEGWWAQAEIYMQAGKPEQALAYYEQAIKMRPGWVTPLNNLAWLRATDPRLRNGYEAVRLAKQAALSSRSQSPELLDTLGAAYAAAGLFPAAVSMSERALTLAEASGRDDLVPDLQQRLALFRAGQPFTASYGRSE